MMLPIFIFYVSFIEKRMQPSPRNSEKQPEEDPRALMNIKFKRPRATMAAKCGFVFGDVDITDWMRLRYGCTLHWFLLHWVRHKDDPALNGRMLQSQTRRLFEYNVDNTFVKDRLNAVLEAVYEARTAWTNAPNGYALGDLAVVGKKAGARSDCYWKGPGTDVTLFSSRLIAQAVYDYVHHLQHTYLPKKLEEVMTNIVLKASKTVSWVPNNSKSNRGEFQAVEPVNISPDNSAVLLNLKKRLLEQVDAWVTQTRASYQSTTVTSTQAISDAFTYMTFVESFILGIPDLAKNLEHEIQDVFGEAGFNNTQLQTAAQNTAKQAVKEFSANSIIQNSRGVNTMLVNVLTNLYTVTEECIRNQLVVDGLKALLRDHLDDTLASAWTAFQEKKNKMDVSALNIPHPEQTYDILVKYFQTKPIMYLRVVTASKIRNKMVEQFVGANNAQTEEKRRPFMTGNNQLDIDLMYKTATDIFNKVIQDDVEKLFNQSNKRLKNSLQNVQRKKESLQSAQRKKDFDELPFSGMQNVQNVQQNVQHLDTSIQSQNSVQQGGSKRRRAPTTRPRPTTR
jgi:hypothetical protein